MQWKKVKTTNMRLPRRFRDRVSMYDVVVLAKEGYIRTFDKEMYRLFFSKKRGMCAINAKTQEVKDFTIIYKDIKTVIDKTGLEVAKRLRKNDELRKIEYLKQTI
ncbi:hypothetical protein JCM21714_2111 [Gracilibacillus boraciitolerans JCM 21714]|uniref:Uncharacterized protein n=2 Tax=Gracilibacillus boraciitolerans TaxID=307521 RepID=W4VJY0_9BACI|nr:hypothetical protein JCM21714_2111 [Gracilibacillus boraciitolerans JCM 21714]